MFFFCLAKTKYDYLFFVFFLFFTFFSFFLSFSLFFLLFLHGSQCFIFAWLDKAFISAKVKTQIDRTTILQKNNFGIYNFQFLSHWCHNCFIFNFSPKPENIFFTLYNWKFHAGILVLTWYGGKCEIPFV